MDDLTVQAGSYAAHQGSLKVLTCHPDGGQRGTIIHTDAPRVTAPHDRKSKSEAVRRCVLLTCAATALVGCAGGTAPQPKGGYDDCLFEGMHEHRCPVAGEAPHDRLADARAAAGAGHQRDATA